MARKLLLLFALLLLATSPSWANVTYQVTVDTSSLASTSGSLDFQFNPGFLTTQPANLQILNFSSDGTPGGSPTLTGDVSGALPGTVAFDNGSLFNDYFTGFTYGNSLTFSVDLFGPAVTSPDGTSSSGSSFAFSMFSDPGGTIPVLTNDPSGFALTIDINLDGSTTPTNSSSVLTVQNVTPAPEPPTLLLLVSAFASASLLRKRRIQRHN